MTLILKKKKKKNLIATWNEETYGTAGAVSLECKAKYFTYDKTIHP